MSYIQDETKSRLPAYVCVADAKARDAKNIVLYNDSQIKAGEQLLEKVQGAYYRSKVYRNYRENFIAVKVDKPNIADKVSKEVQSLNTYCSQNGIDLVSTKSNLVYRIKL